jgi:L-threonylcarbamoyladenylate synthase
MQALDAFFGNALEGVLDAPLGGQASPTVIRDALSGTILRS